MQGAGNGEGGVDGGIERGEGGNDAISFWGRGDGGIHEHSANKAVHEK